MATIRKRGKRYHAQVRLSTAPPLTKSFSTLTDAKAWAAIAESEIQRGLFVDRSEAQKNSVGDLFARYAREVSPLKKGSATEATRLLALQRDPLARYKAGAVTGRTIAEFRDRRLQKVSGSTVNRDLGLISHVFTIAMREWGVALPANPVAMVRRPKTARARVRRLNPGEEERLLAALEPTPRAAGGRFAEGGRNEWMRPLVLFAIESAMRRGELLGLRWTDVFIEARFVRLHDTKNGFSRDVPLSSKAVAILESLPKDSSGMVFPLSAAAVKKSFERAVQRAGLDDLHFHDLRREAATRLATKLDNVLELAAVTGHMSLQVLKRYYAPNPTDLARKLG